MTTSSPPPYQPQQQQSLPSRKAEISPLPVFSPDLYERAWCTIPHPTLPIAATAHAKNVTVFSLTSMAKHSALSGGHSRSIRSLTWKPNLGPDGMCLVTGSFDSTAGIWRWEDFAEEELEREVTRDTGNDHSDSDKEWVFSIVLQGHDSEIKSVQFSPSGVYLATCSRDKSIWIWEDIGANEGDDEWETVAVLNEHEADVKAVAWCPDVPARNARRSYSSEVLASGSYDNTVRIWREDSDGEWVCVSVLEGHEATVWGLQWETKPRVGDKFPRLLSFSADRTVRVWELQEGPDEAGPDESFGSALGGIPNTMRRALRETWKCVAVLPQVHTREVYSASWSGLTGRVATTGSDGRIVVYEEDNESSRGSSTGAPAATRAPGDMAVPAPGGQSESEKKDGAGSGAGVSSAGWRVVATLEQAHGAYEVNHIVWSRRFDKEMAGEKRVREMLITSGDDGVVRPWAVSETA